jgi:predicted GNAT superfamily acetyltransferase
MDVSEDAWGFAPRMVSPAPDLVAGAHSGGLLAGAFEGRRMLGFVFGIPRVNMGESCHHSHLLAIRRDAQGRGLSTLLKLFQRSWCLDRGITLVTWTYDPFLLKNARLNLGKLRGRVRRLLPNFYGEMGGIYGHLPSDRFEVSWRLDDRDVVRAAAGDPTLKEAELEGVPVFRPRAERNPAKVVLPFPAGAPGTYKTDPEGATRARRVFAKGANALFAAGYEGIGVDVRKDGPCYLFRKR